MAMVGANEMVGLTVELLSDEALPPKPLPVAVTSPLVALPPRLLLLMVGATEMVGLNVVLLSDEALPPAPPKPPAPPVSLLVMVGLALKVLPPLLPPVAAPPKPPAPPVAVTSPLLPPVALLVLPLLDELSSVMAMDGVEPPEPEPEPRPTT